MDPNSELTPDLDRLERVRDDLGTTNTGAGTMGAVCHLMTNMDNPHFLDMGACEFQIRGDMNLDELVNGDDIQLFIDCILAGTSALGICFLGDMNQDGDVDIDDVPCFTDVLLGDTACVSCGGGGARPGSNDCNGNGRPDVTDVFFGTSQDCNLNGVPDECDIAGCHGDPACGDCNGNGVPDACDISSGISADGDGNGIPDECEGQQAQSGGSGSVPTLEAYNAFYDWCLTQEWGPHAGCTCSEQFQGMVDMEQTLGLPLGNPTYLPLPQE
ncbi:MAG: hypothetical protein ACE5EQ_11565 [Phycisphaerae bacterium]